MKAIISGYGRMGHMIEKELLGRGIELAEASEDICSIDPGIARECVCIDFTTPGAFRQNYGFIAANFKAAVIGTTGWDDIRDEVIKCFRDNGTPMVYSSNFSLGVNALFSAVRRASEILSKGSYVPSIEEVHHIHKLDAPSGTAKTLGEIVRASLGTGPEITSIREGEVPGIHTVEFRSGCDVLTFRHEAFSREGLAAGAVTAAILADRIEGVHEFAELL
jgi:4-hydroxy-tetrahydrodipicolinate reductase